jgi:nucleoside transporter
MQQFSIMARLSVMMFLQFFVWGAWYVTVGNYMTSHDMGTIIGWAYSVGPLAAIISPLFLGMIADRYFSSERVLGALHLVGGLVMLAAPVVAEQSAAKSVVVQSLFIGVLLVHMLCYMPTLGLTNTLAFHNLTNQEKQFPLIRVFGTIGWIAANFVVSKIFHADTEALQFYLTGGAAILLGVYSFSLPHTPPPAAGQETSIRQILGLDSLRLMKQTSFAVFIMSSFLICIPLAAYYAYAPVFVKAAGFANPAFTMMFGQVSEIFFMLVMPLFFVRLGVKWMLLVGMFAWVLRYGLFATAAPDAVTWMILAGIVLHGICYDFFFVTGFIYVDKKATKEIRGQAQGFLVLVTQGFGMLVGAQVAQVLANRVLSAEVTDLGQWRVFWIVPCIAAAVIMVLFGLLFKDRVAAQVNEGDVAAASLIEEQP